MGHTVTLVPGDGIGPEVIRAACRVVEAAGVEVEWETHHVGIPALEAGASQPLPEEVVASIRRHGVALKGPVTTVAGRQGFRSVNVELRRRLGLYGQIRRCRTWPGVPGDRRPFDVAVIRETTEDLYAGVEAAPGSELAEGIIGLLEQDGQAIGRGAGLSIKWSTEAGTRRAVELAFRHAVEGHRRTLAVVHKATVMRQTDAIFLEVAQAVGARHPEVAVEDVLVDNLCAALVREPDRFEVLVMANMYGDIVSDLAAALAGGVGLVPGVNVGDDALLFEPGHGSAPRHAGLGRANPTASILSAAMLLRALGEEAAAAAIERAVGTVIAEGRVVTYDLKASRDDPTAASTDAMADAVAEALATP